MARYIKLYATRTDMNGVELLYLQIFELSKVNKRLIWYVAYQVIFQKAVKKRK